MAQYLDKDDAKKMIYYPTGRTAAFFDTLNDVMNLIRGLTDFGYNEEDIELFEGREGLEIMDADGHRHGLLDKLIRAAQKTLHTGEYELYELAEREFKDGHFLITVMTKEEFQKNQVAALMKKNSGHAIKYFNPMYVEHFDADTSPRRVEKTELET